MSIGRGSLATRLFGRFLGSAVSNAAGYAVGGAVLPTLEPYTQDLANQTWRVHPVRPLAANAAAQAALRGILTDAEAENEASYTGFDTGRLDTLRRLNASPPPLEEMLALRRREVITEGELDAGIEHLGLLQEWRARVKALRYVVPSVTDMIRFAVREVYDPGQRAALELDAEFPAAFAQDAERIGIAPADARNHWAAHWDLPSYEQGVAMFFRGEISQAQLEGLLRALDYAPTWRPKLLAIARAIPPISDMIRFAVREVYSPQVRAELGLDSDFPDAFVPEAALHGMDRERAEQYWAAHWRLPSANQGYRMLWRGLIGEPELNTLLRALDYPPVWRERLAAIAHLVPGRVDLRRMHKAGILDRAEVKAGYVRLGYTDADAEILTQFAEAEKASGGTAQPWASRARGRLFTVAHDEFMDGSIDEARARTVLADVGASAPEVAAIMPLWTTERTIYRRELSAAQIKKLYKANLRTQTEALQVLTDMGYELDDATDWLEA